MRRILDPLAVCFAAALAACGSVPDNGTAGSGGQAATGGSGEPGGSGGTSGQGGDGGSGGTGVNDVVGCFGALPFSIGYDADGFIDSPGKKYFYALPVSAGDFLTILTRSLASDSPDSLDTAVTLLDAGGTKVLASVDDSYPRGGPNTAFAYRSPVDQTLCVKVEDWTTWASRTPKAKPGPFYLLIDSVPGGFPDAVDTEPNDTTEDAQKDDFLSWNGDYGFRSGFLVYGALDTPSDADEFQFTTVDSTLLTPDGASDAPLNIVVQMPPLLAPPPDKTGINGFGSTLPELAVTVKEASGAVVAAFDPGSAPYGIAPAAIVVPVAAHAIYTVAFARPQGVSAGTNDFYSSAVVEYADYPAEAEAGSGQNDTRATAENLPMTTWDPRTLIGSVVGHLTPAGTDVDVFRFEAHAGDTLSLGCGAERQGSGLRAVTFAIESADAELQSETGTASVDLAWATWPGATKAPVAITADGTYFLEVSAVFQDPTVTGDYYRCQLLLTSP